MDERANILRGLTITTTVITVTISDGELSGEDCEFSFGDIEDGLILTNLEYELLGCPDPIFKRSIGCDCCEGDEALYWKDNEHNAFVDHRGDVLVTVKGHTMEFKVDRCPHCGHLLRSN